MDDTSAPVRFRHSSRGVVLDEDDRILLCRFDIPHPAVPVGHTVVWAAPGGGLEPGESPLDALRRELHEEVGLVLDVDPPHVWHQEVVGVDHAEGVDGIVNDYFLVRTGHFESQGALSDEELAAEHISEMRWWRHDELAAYRGTDLFSPRDLANLVVPLIAGDVPVIPLPLGL